MKYLIFDTNEVLAQELGKSNSDLEVVVKSDEYYRDGAGIWTMDFSRPDDLSRLFEALEITNKALVSIIVNLATITGLESLFDIETQLEQGIFPVFNICQRLLKARSLRKTGAAKQKIRLLFLHETAPRGQLPAYSAVAAFCRSLTMEEPGFIARTIGFDPALSVADRASVIDTEFDASRDKDVEVLYSSAGRKVRRIREIVRENNSDEFARDAITDSDTVNNNNASIHNNVLNIRPGGCYVISGGLGSLGKLVARYLASLASVNIILLSRSSPNAGDYQFIAELEGQGSRVLHCIADIGERESLAAAFDVISKKFPVINGVIHSAGTTQDSLLLRKSYSSFQAVINPKVQGSINLYQATQQQALDFFIFFSSISSVLGNLGQTDYAFANRFQDDLADFLNHYNQNKVRYLSINWPLWEEGGMDISPDQQQWLKDTMGLSPLGTSDGLQSIADALRTDASAILVAPGIDEKLRHHLLPQNFSASTAGSALKTDARKNFHTGNSNHKIVEEFIGGIIAEELKVPRERMNVATALENYGIDSVAIMRISRRFEAEFGELSKTLLYEYQTIRDLAAYFHENYADHFERAHSAEDNSVDNKTAELAGHNEILVPIEHPVNEQVAIIGISGRYPQADNLHTLWDNLVSGKDAISEIPRDRWNHEIYFDADKNRVGKSYSKWGGFLSDIKGFDPLFFNIPPREANHIDPQERQFLQTVWHAIEDAGYTRQALSDARVGVYAGVMWGQYQLFGSSEQQLADGTIPPPASFSSIANRVSYVMNFNGPSLAVDTMCSSSLTAIHLARRALLNGECDYAIAGGVNLIVHPARYLQLCYEKFLSTDGRCRSFGAGGDGYVPGEGVGAVILKPLGKAIEDGDHIYGVLLGSAINHGGKTNGYRVPNPNAQADVIRSALADAKIPPQTLSYIESHGTGTPLGDPIEIVGLKNGMGELVSAPANNEKIAIGSIKSNLGHLESAAAIAGLSKILLQMKHKQLVPSLHAEVLNSHIPFDKTPFQVQRTLGTWNNPFLQQGIPLRAALSSFGAGGSNGHLIVEEFVKQDVQPFAAPCNVLLISARSADQLSDYAQQHLEYLQALLSGNSSAAVECDSLGIVMDVAASLLGVGQSDISPRDPMEALGFNPLQLVELQTKILQRIIPDGMHLENVRLDIGMQDSIERIAASLNELPVIRTPSVSADLLHRICYTLQTGRESFNHRLAIVAADLPGAIKLLTQYCIGAADGLLRDGVFAGRVDTTDQLLEEINPSTTFDYSNLEKLAALWIEGADVKWEKLYALRHPQRISAPSYPFGKKPYWFNEGTFEKSKESGIMNTKSASLNHPLLDSINILQSSKMPGLVFEKYLTDTLPVFREHTLGNKIVFPASAYLEMAITAAQQARPGNYAVKNIVLIKPLFNTAPVSLFININADHEEFTFEAYSIQDGKNIRHLMGRLYALDVANAITGKISLDSLASEHIKLTSGPFYGLLAQQNIGYENYFRCIESVAVIDEQVIASYKVSDAVNQELSDYHTHPIIVDAAFQALASFAVNFGENFSIDHDELKLPFEIGDIRYYRPVEPSGYYVGKKQQDGTYGVNIVDVHGNVCVSLSGIHLRPMPDFGNALIKNTAASNLVDTIVARVANSGSVSESLNELVEQFREVENFAALVALNALKNLGLDITGNQVFDRQQFINSPHIDPRYRKTVAAFLHMMDLQGWLNRAADGELFNVAATASALLNTEGVERHYTWLSQRYPQMAAHLRLLKECSDHYVDIIQGKILATDIMFPGGSMALLEPVYKGNQVADYFNGQASTSVQAYVAASLQAEPRKTVRILEIGAGTGGTSLGVLESLLPYAENVEYFYTDISLGFIQFGKRQYGPRFPFANFKLLNIENNLQDQGFAQQGFDLVIAANVLHATHNIVNTLAQVRRLLKPAGFLVLNEVTHFQHFTAATFGLLDGWWAFNDVDARIPFSPLLNEQQWKNTFEKVGFDKVEVHKPFNSSVAQRVMIAQLALAIDQRDFAEQHAPASKKVFAEQVTAATSSISVTSSPVAMEMAAAIVDGAVRSILQIDAVDYDPQLAFSDYGVDSVIAVDIIQRINAQLDLKLPTTTIFEYPSPRALAGHIATEYGFRFVEANDIPANPLQQTLSPTAIATLDNSDAIIVQTGPHHNLADIAVIGMSGAFPGARNLDEFWQVLAEGRNTITEIPADRWSLSDWYDADASSENRSIGRWGGFMEEMALFDPRFFNISPSEAEYIDPQQRQFLKHAWLALEDAGYSDRALNSINCGVYAGCKAGDYTVSLKEHGKLDSAYAFTGNAESILAARVAYLLNLKGPAISIDTSCSSSLVAIHQACESLRSGESELAIAGGVAALSRPEFLVMASKAGMLSSDGRCWSFDDRANGIVLSEGVGVIVLKPLSLALRDGDRVHAVIKASGVNQDGSTNGITAPSGAAQSALMRRVYQRFDINPGSIHQIEAHGTGTPLGDPIEFSALNNVYSGVPGKRFLGSVKSNIGHSMASAGAAGLFKLILSARHKKIVPTVGYERLNRNIDLTSSPFRIATEIQEWVVNNEPRRGAVSSFGFSGTNAHIVVEEGFDPAPIDVQSGPWLFVFSARSRSALQQVCQSIHRILSEKQLQVAPQDLAYTLLAGRTHHQFRATLVADDLDELTQALREYLATSPEHYSDIRNAKIGAREANDTNHVIDQLTQDFSPSTREHLQALASAFELGVNADWDKLYRGKGRVISLPPYPFAKERYWVGVKPKQSTDVIQPIAAVPSTDKPIYFFEPGWEKSDTATALIWPAGQYLFITSDPLQLEALPLPEQQVSVVLNQTEYTRLNDHTWCIDQANESHFGRLVGELKTENRFPRHIVHLLPGAAVELNNIDVDPGYTLFSIRHLLVALQKHNQHSHINYLIGYDYDKTEQRPIMQAAGGFPLSMMPLMPNLKMAVVGLFGDHPQTISAPLRTELGLLAAGTASTEIKYVQLQRYIFKSRAVEPVFENSRLRLHGTYLISGGASGLGLMFAKFLMKSYQARVILLGRSAAMKDETARELTGLPGQFRYIPADVTDELQMQRALDEIANSYGILHGVIHAAGLKNSKSIAEKSLTEFSTTLSAKVNGTVVLDRLTRKFPLDFFALFSSAASILGDFGEADYAVANRFIDNFADWRELQRGAALRSGVTKVFNWPLWQGGGMSWKGGPSEILFLNLTGFSYLDESSGISAFVQGLNSSLVHMLPATGDATKLHRTILKNDPKQDQSISTTTEDLVMNNQTETKNNVDASNNIDTNPALSTRAIASEQIESNFSSDEDVLGNVSPALTHTLTNIIAQQFKLSPDEIHVNDNFGNLGADSISLKAIATLINKTFSIEIVPAVFFTHTDIQSLVEYLLEEHRDGLVNFYRGPSDVGQSSLPLQREADVIQSSTIQSNVIQSATPDTPQVAVIDDSNKPVDQQANASSQQQTSTQHPHVQAFQNNRQEASGTPLSEPVAVIGIDGIFPGSPDLQSFWKNLVDEADLVAEVPAERWDWREFYGDPNTSKNKMRSKWGAFLSDVDKFDAAFFGISPREADMMDPQHRLFLQVAWHTIEDAGYDPGSLSGRKVGVFAGVQFNDYQALLSNDNIWNERVTTGCAHAMVANRVSYLLNLHGPSEAINTACSGALIAVHRAVKAIQNGEAEMAIAGGVSLILSPYNMLSAGVLDILAPDGRCKTFDKNANGYVKGEGVGAVLLKSLRQAEADGDHIYCVIKGSAENHGGHATSLTAPNGSAQAELIISAVEKSGIDVSTIGYIETHGTGTELGDPTEVEGLKRAFKRLAQGKNNKARYCGLGTVKTNIGHLEPAAGIAGLLKLILAIKHKTIPGNPHFRELNPFIKLEKSPFYIVERTRAWDSSEPGVPRRGGVSSFGFGGANAHVLAEEYFGKPVANPVQKNPQVIPLSALNDERLKEYAANLLAFIQRSQREKGTEIIETAQLVTAVDASLRVEAAAVLNVGIEEVQLEDDYEAIGLSGENLIKLNNRLTKKYRLNNIETLIFSEHSLGKLTRELVKNYAGKLADYHQDCRKFIPDVEQEPTSLSIENIAFTLQLGRKAYPSRLAFTAKDIPELIEKLSAFIAGDTRSDIFSRGGKDIAKTKQVEPLSLSVGVESVLDGNELEQLVSSWIANGKTEKLARLWVAGVNVTWTNLIPAQHSPVRISLPTYPFAKTRHWFTQGEVVAVEAVASTAASASSVEQKIMDIWREHLGVANIDLDSDFLALGGDSIISTKITSAIEREYQVKIPAGQFMKASTVREVANLLNKVLGEENTIQGGVVDAAREQPLSTGKPIHRETIKHQDSDSNPLSSGQQRFWFLNKLHPHNAAFNISAALKLDGELVPESLNEAYHWLIARHDIFRTVFATRNGITEQIVKPHAINPLGVIDLQNTNSQESSHSISQFQNQPFDLEQDSLLRVGLIKVANNTYLLKVVIHHIISDVWSVGIIFRELLTRYLEIREGKSSQLPAVAVHFGDYARWQQANLPKVVEAELSYWQSLLANAPDVIPLPFDYPRQELQTFDSARITSKISPELHQQLKSVAKAKNVSLYVLLFAAFNILLAKLTKQDDILVGSPVANRRVPETENMIGFLANTLVFRNNLSGNPSIAELLDRVQQNIFDAFDHQSVPFSKVVEAVKPRRLSNANPLFQVMFNMFPPMIPAENGPVRISPYPLSPTRSDYDLVLNVEERDSGIDCQLDYNTQLFKTQTAEFISASWLAVVNMMVTGLEKTMAQIRLGQDAINSDTRYPATAQRTDSKIIVASTFVAEPITQVLSHWTNRYSIASSIAFADYNQVFQQLLDPGQQLLQNAGGYNLLLININDWVRFEKPISADSIAQKLESTMHEFIRALRSAATFAKSPIGVIFCPVREWLASSSLYDRLEQLAVQETANLPNVHLLTSATISQRYPVDDIHDIRADEQAHIPYSNAFYAALATGAARLFFSLHYKAHKVIVLDCDNTLWRGVVGEDGVRGIEIDAAFKRWQEFLVRQQASGRLLCLCSKNNPDDVFAVIDQRNDMLLKREHIVSWRINWTRKSDNLRELAQELDLGLDSFIFIDDNPAEIDEVRSSLPEVLSLTFPKDPLAINHFIADTWVFDQLTSTEEDQKRTQMYRENADRERFRKSTSSYAEFLASLNLTIQIDRLTPATLARVSQLTYRTNQFNFSGLRRSESELQQHLQHNRMECLTVEVKDRFGDYGLVGAVIFGQSQDQLIVDTFLMSCRVLSKGVEHRLVNELGRIAAQRGLSEIAFYFADSGKNVPAKNFLDALPEVRLDALDNSVLGKPSFAYRLSRAAAERLVVTTREADTEVVNVAIRKTAGSFSILRAIEEDALSPGHAQVQVKTTLPTAINGNSITAHHVTESANPASVNVNTGELEEIIAGTIRDALGIGRLGRNDNFFDLGAHSSLLVAVASQLEARLNVELPIVKLFQYPSVAALAGFLSSGKPQEGARRLVRDKGKSQRRKLLELRQAQLALEPTSA